MSSTSNWNVVLFFLKKLIRQFSLVCISPNTHKTIYILWVKVDGHLNMWVWRISFLNHGFGPICGSFFWGGFLKILLCVSGNLCSLLLKRLCEVSRWCRTGSSVSLSHSSCSIGVREGLSAGPSHTPCGPYFMHRGKFTPDQLISFPELQALSRNCWLNLLCITQHEEELMALNKTLENSLTVIPLALYLRAGSILPASAVI